MDMRRLSGRHGSKLPRHRFSVVPSCVDSYALISAPTHSQDSQTSFMPPASRDHARIERHLIAALTDACEIAKAEIPGFEWLTHTVDYRAFPQSLRVIWVVRQRREQGSRPRDRGGRPYARADYRRAG